LVFFVTSGTSKLTAWAVIIISSDPTGCAAPLLFQISTQFAIQEGGGLIVINNTERQQEIIQGFQIGL
jgi:hypothetical protein